MDDPQLKSIVNQLPLDLDKDGAWTKDLVFHQVILHLSHPRLHHPNVYLYYEALKIICREPSYSERLYKDQAVYSKLLEFAIGATSNAKLANEADAAICTLINILFNLDAARQQFARVTWPVLLKSTFAANFDERASFLKLRLAFLATIEEAGAKLIIEEEKIAELCQMALDAFRQSKDQLAVEMSRIMYNASRFVAGREPDEKQLLTTIIQILSLSIPKATVGSETTMATESRFPHENLILAECSAVNTLLNISDQVIRDNYTSKVDHLLLDLVKSILDQFITITNGAVAMVGNPHNSIPDMLAPLLLVLARYAGLLDGMRKTLRKAILPGKFDQNVKPEESGGYKAKLILLQRGPNTRLNEAIGEFLYSLVKRDLLRFIYHLGYGNAAGYVFGQKLMGKLQQIIQDYQTKVPQYAAPLSSDEEELQRQDCKFNLITGSTRNNSPTLPTQEEMTEEEKLAETQRLMDLFERMEKTGVIKVYRSEEDK